MANQGFTTPNSIDIQHGDISIQWSDGHTSTHPHRFLRLECHCATCVGEWPNKGELDPHTPLSSDDPALLKVLAGHVKTVFTDYGGKVGMDD